jgi:hypothetical protein
MGCVRLWATTWGSPRSLAQWNSTKNGKKTSKDCFCHRRAKPQRAEYVERLCRQFDFGTPIASRFVIALRGWKDIFDRFPILDSPAYHAIRAYFRWERFTPRCKTPAGNPNGNSRTFAKDGLRIGQCNFTGENADYATVGHTAIITSKSMRLQRKINAIIETTSAVRLMTSIRCSPASAL